MWNGYLGAGPWGYGGAAMGVFMVLFWLIVLVGVAAIVWAMVRSVHHVTHAPPHVQGSSALRILEERYARGEVDKEEFDQKRRDLQQ